jgi:hypothetical protein
MAVQRSSAGELRDNSYGLRYCTVHHLAKLGLLESHASLARQPSVSTLKEGRSHLGEGG